MEISKIKVAEIDTCRHSTGTESCPHVLINSELCKKEESAQSGTMMIKNHEAAAIDSVCPEAESATRLDKIHASMNEAKVTADSMNYQSNRLEYMMGNVFTSTSIGIKPCGAKSYHCSRRPKTHSCFLLVGCGMLLANCLAPRDSIIRFKLSRFDSLIILVATIM